MADIIKGTKIRPELLNFLLDNKKKQALQQINRTTGFKVPDHLPGYNIVTDADTVKDSDILLNDCDFSPFDKINKTLLNSRFLGYPQYALLSQNGIIDRIVQGLANDMTQEWVTIYSTDDSGVKRKTAQEIIKLEDFMDSLDIRDVFNQAAQQTFRFGGCKIYPKIKGDDSKEGGNESELEMKTTDAGKVGRDSLLYLQLIEPQYATPVAVNYTNPKLRNFYVPEKWNIQGDTTHSSRLCHFVYNQVPTLLRPVYWFNGMPLVQLCLDYLYGFEKCRQDIVGITGRYNINVLSTNLLALITENKGDYTQEERGSILDRLQIAQALQNNFSIFAIDNNKEAPEKWEQFSMNLTGLSEIMEKNAEYLCTVTGYSYAKLHGRSEGGLNSSGEGSERNDNKLIGGRQNSIFRKPYKHLFELAQMSLFGRINPALKFKFNPLWKMSEKEDAEIQLIKSQINIGYVGAQILAPEEVRDALSRDPDSGYESLEQREIDLVEPDDENDRDDSDKRDE